MGLFQDHIDKVLKIGSKNSNELRGSSRLLLDSIEEIGEERLWSVFNSKFQELERISKSSLEEDRGLALITVICVLILGATEHEMPEKLLEKILSSAIFFIRRNRKRRLARLFAHELAYIEPSFPTSSREYLQHSLTDLRLDELLALGALYDTIETNRQAEQMNRLYPSAAADLRRAGKKCTILSVHSLKGGVGKSLLCYGIASQLQEAGARVCVIDLDFYGPSAQYILRIPDLEKLLRDRSKGHWGRYAEQSMYFSKSLGANGFKFEDMLYKVDRIGTVIPITHNPARLPRVADHFRNDMTINLVLSQLCKELEAISEAHDFVIIDTHAGLYAHQAQVIELLFREADSPLIVVSSPRAADIPSTAYDLAWLASRERAERSMVIWVGNGWTKDTGPMTDLCSAGDDASEYDIFSDSYLVTKYLLKDSCHDEYFTSYGGGRLFECTLPEDSRMRDLLNLETSIKTSPIDAILKLPDSPTSWTTAVKNGPAKLLLEYHERRIGSLK